jgi:diadenylate cyclase
MGEDGRIVYLQLNDLLSGVEFTKRSVLRDYSKPLRPTTVRRALEDLSALPGTDLEDPSRLGKELGFPDLDDPADPRGYRLLSQVGRLPDAVRDDIVKHFGSVSRLLAARVQDLIKVEGVGDTRADQLRAYFDRLLDNVNEWEPVLD